MRPGSHTCWPGSTGSGSMVRNRRTSGRAARSILRHIRRAITLTSLNRALSVGADGPSAAVWSRASFGPHEDVELFGKRIARTHGLMRTVSDTDHSFEFFLVVRPRATGHGRLVKRWILFYEELGRVIPPAL